jgi:hypothetical protein
MVMLVNPPCTISRAEEDHHRDHTVAEEHQDQGSGKFGHEFAEAVGFHGTGILTLPVPKIVRS